MILYSTPMKKKKSLLQKTIWKMVRSQKKKQEVITYMEKHSPHLLWNEYRSGKIRECCNILRFLNYWSGNVKLYTANFCKYDKLCLACATRRAIKKIQHFEQWIVQYWLEKKYWYHITLTIRHSKKDSLEQLMDRLISLRKKLSQYIRNSKRKEQKKESFFSQFEGMVASVEVTYWKHWWHPHLHVLVCWDISVHTEYSSFLKTESNKELQKEWYSLTNDSYSVAIRKINVSKHHFDRQWIAEVFKYAVKFTTLEVPQLVELIALQKKKQYRFYATFGSFRGRKVEPKKYKKKLTKHDITYSDKIIYSDFKFDPETNRFWMKTRVLEIE